MASEKAQTSIPMEKQDNPIDRAIRAVRDFQTGKCTVGFVQAALSGLDSSALQWVSVGTRLPLGQLQSLRGTSTST